MDRVQGFFGRPEDLLVNDLTTVRFTRWRFDAFLFNRSLLADFWQLPTFGRNALSHNELSRGFGSIRFLFISPISFHGLCVK
jgi:hypothetical protein